MQNGNFEAWLIDLDGTLYRQTPVRWLMAVELVLLAPHRIRAVQRFRQEQERMRHDQAAPVATKSPRNAT